MSGGKAEPSTRPRSIAAARAPTRVVDLLTEIARRFYLGDESQTEIARDLGLDPSTVSRHLKRAREQGIVHVEIRSPRRDDVDLGRAVAERYGIARAVVAPAGQDLDELFGPIAAEFVGGLLRSGMRLGVSWGRTVASVVRHLRPGVVGDLSIAQLAGGINDPVSGIQGNELVRQVADKYSGSEVSYLHAPAIVGSEMVRDVLLADRTIKAAIESAERTELALVGIGQMEPDATLHAGGHVGTDDWNRLVADGAVGNMNTRFFDAAGAPVGLLEGRTIAIAWQALRDIPTVIAVATGRERAAAIRGALATRSVDILVTDDVTARALLKPAQRR
jgi:DNA-binding transcriptional regulator LsrR (DeoR family)